MTSKRTIFISHSAVDADLAKFFGDKLEKDFLNGVVSFVSSRPQDNRPGLVWYNSIISKLLKSVIILVLANRSSIERPWINFEAGAGIGLGVPVIPLCCGGLIPGQIEGPLHHHQALLATKPTDLKTVYAEVAAVANMDVPVIDFEDFSKAIADFGSNDLDERRVRELLKSLDFQIPGALKGIANLPEGERLILSSVNSIRFEEARIFLRELRDLGMLDFDWMLSSFTMMAAKKEERENMMQTSALRSAHDGMFHDIRIEASKPLVGIAYATIN